MARTPHYWRKEKTCSLPQHIVVFDTETRWEEIPEPHPHQQHRLRVGVAMSYRLRNGERSGVDVFRFRESESFWTWLHGKCKPKQKLYVYAHNTAFDLGVIGGWARFCADCWQWSHVILDNGVLDLDGQWNGLPIRWGDTWNYYHCSLARIAKGLGQQKEELPSNDGTDEDWFRRCTTDVMITADAIDAVIKFVQTHDYGPFGPTVASLAFHTYKRAFMEQRVLVHDHAPALRIERSAYYGGIVDTPFIGTVPVGPLYECDVQSMYPHCSLAALPYHIAGYTVNPNPLQVQHLLNNLYCYADVTLRTPSVPYPFRRKDRVVHPIGTYRTCLAHPELIDADDRGVIAKVHAISYHKHANLFRHYMETMFRHRQRYAREGNSGFANVAKLLANSLYGKTGQLSPRWVEWGPEAIRRIEDENGLPEGTLEHHGNTSPSLYTMEGEYHFGYGCPPYALRSIWGGVEVCVKRVESRDSYPAIAATITSYARLRLRELQRIASWGHYFYCDTDSLWVDDTGLAHLKDAGEVVDNTLGKLKVADVYRSLDVHAPKDYAPHGGSRPDNEVIRRKGIRLTAEPLPDGRWRQLQFPSALTQLEGGPDVGINLTWVSKRLYRTNDHCDVMTGGWTTPLVIEE